MDVARGSSVKTASGKTIVKTNEGNEHHLIVIHKRETGTETKRGSGG